ncbi:putative integron cassette domain protein [Burkholderia pseudomallei MSHR4375]|nr:putative integron cassette domain protein [Burkholderia pseudomallei MSHR4375]
MITVITSFQLPAPLAREEARSLFLRAAPKHQGVVGLCANTMSCRKAEGRVYLWNARAQAETMYTDIRTPGKHRHMRHSVHFRRSRTLKALPWSTTQRTRYSRTSEGHRQVLISAKRERPRRIDANVASRAIAGEAIAGECETHHRSPRNLIFRGVRSAIQCLSIERRRPKSRARGARAAPALTAAPAFAAAPRNCPIPPATSRQTLLPARLPAARKSPCIAPARARGARTH